MDVKEKVAAIKTAVALPRGGNTSPELVRSAYTMLSFLAGFMLSAARLLGSGSPFGVAAVAAAGPGIYGAGCLIGAGLGYIVTGGLSCFRKRSSARCGSLRRRLRVSSRS